jgi:aryl-alcohol dehydrogenase-like predicted oxidoreductase
MVSFDFKWSRRDFLKNAGLAAALASLPIRKNIIAGTPQPMKRHFGKLDFEVTTLGLGGQASLQWTPQSVNPSEIILKAFHLGVNYFDTSNLYGSSQANLGGAFRQLHLVPGLPGYDEKLRRSIFLTSKTHLRWGKGGERRPNVGNWTNGDPASRSADDLRRSLSLMFGDGKGNYPEGAYLNMALIHNLNTIEEVDVLFQGLEDTDTRAEHIGALAVLRDFRDGTNRTGMNPKEERLVRHVGFSGHFSAPVMMEMIRRDKSNLLDAVLVAVNANDRLYTNMQHNVLPLARAKGMGIIGMKVFADGAMYSKDARWSHMPQDVVQSVGGPSLPSAPLVQYTLTTAGVHTAIIGTGHIDNDPSLCQLESNWTAAQVKPGGLSPSEREKIEQAAALAKNGKTNYFQKGVEPLSPAGNPKAENVVIGEKRTVRLSWDTAIAGTEPVLRYDIVRDGRTVASAEHRPQTDLQPFIYEDKPKDRSGHEYRIITVDASGRISPTEPMLVASAE